MDADEDDADDDADEGDADADDPCIVGSLRAGDGIDVIDQPLRRRCGEKMRVFIQIANSMIAPWMICV